MSLNEHEAPRPVSSSRGPLGYGYWTGAVLAVLGIALVVASGAGSLSPANALRMVLMGVGLELLAIPLLLRAGARRVMFEREQTAKRIEEARREIGNGARPRSNRFRL